jgi:hypothetical protein
MTFLEALKQALELAFHGHLHQAEETLRAYFTGESPGDGTVHTNDGGGGQSGPPGH